MIDKVQLCAKITELYPDIGECGIDIDVEYDEARQTWIVDLKKDQFELKTYLEDGDAARPSVRRTRNRDRPAAGQYRTPQGRHEGAHVVPDRIPEDREHPT